MDKFNLTEGQLKDNEKVNLFSCISQSLFRGAHTTTYKYGFLKSLLDNIFLANSSYEIKIDDLNATFGKIYWNLVNVHHIPQSPRTPHSTVSGMERAINEFSSANHLDNVQFDSLSPAYQKKYLAKSKPCMKKYVFGAFYGDTDGYLFGFSKKNDAVWLNEKSFHFLSENKALLEQANYYEWLKMCEAILDRANSSYNNLSTVLENITKRADLSYFKDELNKLATTQTCFYCGKHLTSSSPLDHVIPWDFMKQDELWDLVFCCQSCNSSKNNRIPAQEFLDKLKERNDSLGITSPNIKAIVDIAKLNGVDDGWTPKKK